MSSTGLLNVLMFFGLFLCVVALVVWEFKCDAKRQARLDAEEQKRAGQS